MHADPRVLIVSTKADVATDTVARCLADRGIQTHRLNTEDYPFARTLTYRPAACEAWLTSDARQLEIPTSIWYRRLRTPTKPSGLDDGIYDFCLQETRAAIVGSVLSRSARWMSHPSAIWQAEHKPFQLAVAVRLGLTIPRTVVTNEPSAVRTAFQDYGRMIVKPTRSGYLQTSEGEHAIYTSLVLEEHLAQLESVRWSPAIYQELVPKLHDVRVTVVGHKLFGVAIDSQSDPAATIDWRKTSNPQLPHHRLELPTELTDKLHALMRSLNLTFGAIDLVRTPDDEYVFLEVNPSGQWLWLDDMLGLGISDAVADWLAAS